MAVYTYALALLNLWILELVRIYTCTFQKCDVSGHPNWPNSENCSLSKDTRSTVFKSTGVFRRCHHAINNFQLLWVIIPPMSHWVVWLGINVMSHEDCVGCKSNLIYFQYNLLSFIATFLFHLCEFAKRNVFFVVAIYVFLNISMVFLEVLYTEIMKAYHINCYLSLY